VWCCHHVLVDSNISTKLGFYLRHNPLGRLFHSPLPQWLSDYSSQRNHMPRMFQSTDCLQVSVEDLCGENGFEYLEVHLDWWSIHTEQSCQFSADFGGRLYFLWCYSTECSSLSQLLDLQVLCCLHTEKRMEMNLRQNETNVSKAFHALLPLRLHVTDQVLFIHGKMQTVRLV
jgi:hypothetical protein